MGLFVTQNLFDSDMFVNAVMSPRLLNLGTAAHTGGMTAVATVCLALGADETLYMTEEAQGHLSWFPSS